MTMSDMKLTDSEGAEDVAADCRRYEGGTTMSDMKLTTDQIKDALRRCVGAASIMEDKGCEGCPLYEDHYCVDTLCAILEQLLDAQEDYQILIN